MYYLYLIRNKRTNELYTGYSSDLKRRLYEHGVNFELIYYEAYKNKKDAQNRERKLKLRGQAIRWLKQRVKYSLN